MALDVLPEGARVRVPLGAAHHLAFVRFLKKKFIVMSIQAILTPTRFQELICVKKISGLGVGTHDLMISG